MVRELLALLEGLPPGLTYALLSAGSALENLLPPVPADTFILLGGFLAGRGRLGILPVFLVTWTANVGSALVVYWIGRTHGRVFFDEGMGRRVLRPRQLNRMGRFYERWGPPAIFLARFLPGLRAVVPAFAGVTRQRFWPVAVPVAVASAIWYGTLVWLGATAGRNLDRIASWITRINSVLLVLALVLAGAVALWWVRSRAESG